MYLRVIKTDFAASKQIPVSKRGDPEARRVVFKFDDLNQISGDYDFVLVGVTDEGLQTEFDLGSINVWFKEGNPELVNDGVHESYAPKPQIVAQFPTPYKVNSPLPAIIFCGLIGVSALVFFLKMCSLSPNTGNMTLSGIFGMGAVLGVMGVIVGFWFGHANLI